MWFGPRSGVSKSRDEVGAIDVSAQNRPDEHTMVKNSPVAGSLRVRQLCGVVDELANAINTRERQ